MSYAWQFDHPGGFEVLEKKPQTIPDTIPPGHALIKIKASGLNNSELRFFQGKYAVKPPVGKTCFIGGEAVGEIVSLGASDGSTPYLSHEFKVGDRVAFVPGSFEVNMCGTYRTHGVYPVKYLLPVPENYSDEEGAAFWMSAITSIGALNAAGVTKENAKGKRIVVTAAGSGVATLALQIIRAWGGIAIAVTRFSEKVLKIQELKIADYCIAPETIDSLEMNIKEMCKGEGFDVALDPTGGSHFEALSMAASLDAHIVIYEMLGGTDATIKFGTLLRKDLSIQDRKSVV